MSADPPAESTDPGPPAPAPPASDGRASTARTAEALRLLADVSVRLVGDDRPEALVGGLLARLAALLRLDLAFSYLLEEDAGAAGGGRLRLHASFGVDDDTRTLLEVVGVGESVCGLVVRDRRAVVLHDVHASADPAHALLRRLGAGTHACFPLLAEEAVIGMLSFGRAAGAGFHADEVALLGAVADQLALALHRSRLVAALTAEAGERRRAEAALHRSAARYRALFERLDDGFCVLQVLHDAAGRPVDYRFLETNAAFARQTGLVAAVGRTARELVPDLEPHWPERYGRVAATGEAARFQQGSAAMGRWFDVSAFPVGAPDERQVALLFRDITAVREAEQERERLVGALEVERARLAYVFQQAPSFLAVLRGPGLVFTLVNDAYYQIVGHRDIVGKSVWEALPEVRGQGFEALLAGVLATGEPYIGREVPLVVQRTPGAPPEERFVDLAYIPIVEGDGAPDGRPTGIIAHGTDVTAQVLARREVERLLARSERARVDAERARAETAGILGATSDGILGVDLEGRTTFANAAAERMLGWTAAELVGRPQHAMIHHTRPDGTPYPLAGCALYRAVRDGVPARVDDELFWRRDGSGFPVEYAMTPLTDGEAVVGAVVTFQDVSARREAEAERRRLLAQAEAARDRAHRLQALTAALAAATTPEAVAEVVVAQAIAATGAATAMLALRVPGAVPAAGVLLRQAGLTPLVPVPDAHFPLTIPGPAAACLRDGTPFFLETREVAHARFPELRDVWERLATQAVATIPLGADDAPGGVVGAMSFTFHEPRAFPADERAFFLALGVQVAQALERARLIAAERDARAAAEVAQDLAEAAQREAQGANQAKSAFLATMSHELRTPINAMIGYAQLLELGLAGPLTDQQRAFLERLAASSRHLLSLVNDVLDLSKIEAGETRVARRDATTGPAIRGALDLVRPQASAQGVALVDDRSDEVGIPFVGDEDRVRQVTLNLIGNAVKFTPRGGTVTVSCGTEPDTPPAAGHLRGAGPWAYVRVADTGVGIPAAEHGRIFEPFHQVDNRHTRTQGGTGLGLAISRRLARLMGGDLTVESAPGAGSTFTLWLPAARREGDAATETATQRGARAERQAERQAERTMAAHTLAALHVPGLGDVGETLGAVVPEVVAAYADRLRGDPAIPRARDMRRVALEDHAVSLLADLAQSLVIAHEAGPESAALLGDGGAIQRAVAEAHGARRFAQQWDEAALRRDHQILGEEVERAVRAARAGDAGDAGTGAAVPVLLGFLDRAAAISLGAWRRAAQLVEAE